MLPDLSSLVTPLVVVLLLVLLVVICTLVMLTDYVVKGARYTKWKNLPPSSPHSPEHCGPVYPPYNSLSTISEYIPLCAENHDTELQVDGGGYTPTAIAASSPVKRRRRRLLRRRETLSDWCLTKAGVEMRKSSLPVTSRLLKRSSSVRCNPDAPGVHHANPTSAYETRLAAGRGTRSRRRAGNNKRDSHRSSASTATFSVDSADRTRPVSSCASSSDRPASDDGATLRPATSVSGFSCTSNELEYDLYDCDIGNVMAAPGSMFAPAYWTNGGDDMDVTPTLDLELTQLFPKDDMDGHNEAEEEVELRRDGGGGGGRANQLVTSMTSDLTSSISSAVSGSTLVGEEEEEVGEETALMFSGGKRAGQGGLETSCYYSEEEEVEGEEERVPCLRPQGSDNHNKMLMNITHIDDEIAFVDD